MQKTFGRITILGNFTEQQLLNATPKKRDEMIIEVLKNAEQFHEQNKNDTIYLKRYLLGDQDIKNKVKYTREEINNKTTENWVYALTEFKKSFLLGKPIQYVQLNDAGGAEISKLNQYVRYENKQTKDLLLYEDVLTCGRGFRYVNKDPLGSEDEAPFEIINCPAEHTEVVYSSALGNEQLFAYIETPMQYFPNIDPENKEIVTKPVSYMQYDVYLRNMKITYSTKSGALKREGKPIPLLWGEHIITEYYLNRGRISMIEIGKDLFDDINYLESLDKDDMEQFVNAIMVFTNAEIDEDGLKGMKKLGAVSIKSTDQMKASVDLLQGRLNATDTQTYYTRLLTSLFQILGVPLATDNGTVTSGDTGKAKLTGQGFTSAGIRAEADETMFKMADINSLKVILKICRDTAGSEITNLKVVDIDAKFQRDMSDNLLVKTQGLMNLYSCDIPREFANSIVNLFSDSNAVTEAQNKLFGKQVSQTGSQNTMPQDTSKNVDENDVTDNQDNKMKNIEQKETQGQ